jgi:hypothetical protein
MPERRQVELAVLAVARNGHLTSVLAVGKEQSKGEYSPSQQLASLTVKMQGLPYIVTARKR